MNSKLIATSYLKRFFLYWLVCSCLLVSFQTLLLYFKDVSHLPSHLLLRYLLVNFFRLFLELCPISLFIATLLVNWQWTHQRLWLASRVIGTPIGQFRKLLFAQFFISCCVVILPLKLTLLPYDKAVTLARLEFYQKLPSIKEHEVVIHNSVLFYPLSNQHVFTYHFDTAQSQVESYGLGQYALSTPSHHLNLQWKMMQKIGLAKWSFWERLDLLRSSHLSPEIQSQLLCSLYVDVSYILLLGSGLVMGWGISPIQVLLREATFSPLLALWAASLLYLGLKMLPIIAPSLGPTWTFLGYWAILGRHVWYFYQRSALGQAP